MQKKFIHSCNQTLNSVVVVFIIINMCTEIRLYTKILLTKLNFSKILIKVYKEWPGMALLPRLICNKYNSTTILYYHKTLYLLLL